MKEQAVNRVAWVVRTIVKAILGEGMVPTTEHVRRVRKTYYPEISC